MQVRWDAVIFDCDGTLVDSERLGNEVLVEHVEQFGVRLTVDDALTRFRGTHMAACVEQLELLRGEPLPASFVVDLRERMATAFAARLQPIAGALDLVRSLTIPFCVASSGPRAKIELSLSLTGLLPYFGDRIFSSYELQAWKPSPDLFMHAARAMDAELARCAVIEDSLPGIHAGLAAGMQVFALQRHGIDPLIPKGVTVITELRELHVVFSSPRRAS